ncbi:MAG TPA: hypothetical protein VIJ47_03740 [Acidimicrobiales bacterium]
MAQPLSYAVAGGRSVITVLQRLVPLARRLIGAVRVLAVASAIAIMVIVATVLGHGLPSIPVGVLLLVVIAVLAPAPAMLWIFHGALREALELPEWLRRSPEVAKGHASELADLVAESRRSGPREGRGFFRDTTKAGRLLLETHRDLPGYGSLLRLVSIPFLIAVGIAVFAAIFEVSLAVAIVSLDVVVRLVT